MPQYSGMITISTANANRDGTGTVPVAITAPNTGLSISYFWIKARDATTAGMIRMFIFDNAGSPVASLLEELIVTAITPAAGVESWEGVIEFNARLPAGYSVRFSTHNAETFYVHTFL